MWLFEHQVFLDLPPIHGSMVCSSFLLQSNGAKGAGEKQGAGLTFAPARSEGRIWLSVV
jgi:hypothetical protein